MARVSFTFRKEPVVDNLQGGSTLQNILSGDDDSALRGDTYVSSPTAILTEEETSFSAQVIDYGRVLLKWSIGTPLSTPVDATPVATSITVRWDTIGEPQTVANGQQVTTITADRVNESMEHFVGQDGVWVYYSIFVKYEGIGVRAWYEKVGDVHVLLPNRYGSTNNLYSRISRHWRLQDTDLGIGVLNTSSELFGYGQLYRALDIFGWDIDRLRTHIHHQTVTKDPQLATSEALDALAYELGVDLRVVDLGTERLRNIITDIGYLRQSKGTVSGVREWLTAISGSDVEIRTTPTNYLTSTQASCGGTITNTTNGALLPTGNTWVVESTTATATAVGGGGMEITRTGGTDYEVVVAKTKILDMNQGSTFTAYYDAYGATNASVFAVYLSPDLAAGTAAYTNASTGFGFLTDKTGESRTDGTDWFQVPVYLGMPGNGTFTTTPMYLHVYMMLGPDAAITLNNFKVYNNDAYPYEIDIISQRANLLRDPQFNYTNDTQWTNSPTATTPTAVEYATTYGLAPALSDAVLWLDASQSLVTGGSLTNLGTGGAALNAKFGSAAPSAYFDGTAMVLPGGIVGNYASVPDAAPLRVTGDIDLLCRVALNDWTPATPQCLGGRWNDPSNHSYLLRVNAAGGIQFNFSTDGTNNQSVNSLAALPSLVDGIPYWIRATRNATSGDISFYYANDSESIPTTWTAVGASTAVGGAGAIFAGTNPLEVGAFALGTLNAAGGKFYRFVVRNGIDGPAVFDADFAKPFDTTSFTATTGQTVTLNRSTSGTDTNDPTLLPHTGTNYLYLPGVAGNYASTPDAAALDITGNLCLVADVAPTDWTPGSTVRLGGKDNAYVLNLNTTGQLAFSYVDSGLAVRNAATSGPLGFTDGVRRQVAVTYVAGTGVNDVRFWTRNTSSDPWVQFGTTQSSGGVDIRVGGNAAAFGATDTGTAPLTGSLYRFTIYASVGASNKPPSSGAVLDADFTTGITSGGQTTFTCTTGQTVTINRATSGLKAVAVTRPVVLMATNDYLEVADSPLLDFAAGESFTVMAVLRQWGTPSVGNQAIVSKVAFFSLPIAGWQLYNGGVSLAPKFVVSDGVVLPNVANATVSSSGALSTFTAVRDVAADLLRTFNGNTAGVTTTDTTTGSLSNSLPMRIGAYANSAGNLDFEFVAAAVFRRALTAAEIAQISSFYQTAESYSSGSTPATAGRGTRSYIVTTAASGGSLEILPQQDSPYRVGIPYYFSVDDVYNNIDSVQILSTEYGLIATGELQRESLYSDGSVRKVWKLYREYAEPWVAQNLTDTNLVINATSGVDKKVEIRRPLLEYINASGDYFDGDNPNGGWLASTTLGVGVADYRWGAAGKNDSFSYYTSDYQRTIFALKRELGKILPATQTDDPADILNFNRIYAYTGVTLL